ncbi:MAG: cell division protein FtsA [Alphaproteobacteria bacterium]|jgi:cell division protein FtsA|nr:cell division protein FtsA [Alphaproteobacteria bacterium]MDP7223201.1 cell division protein FtsA [Alphaproteobacteria bacterium]
MSKKFKPSFKPKGSVFAALDIGSSKIACLIARIVDDNGNYEILGAGHQASHGVKSGVVTDQAEIEQVIRQVVHTAEHMAANAMKGYPLREVVMNVAGTLATSHNFQVGVEIAGQEIIENDVRRAMVKAQEQILTDDIELIHTIPVGYMIDGNDGIREPRGMYGETLDVNIHLVTGESTSLRNIATAVQHSHLDIDALCLSSYAAGLSSLVEDEMDLGCTVIDMGGGVTSFALFQSGSLIYADAVPLGGKHVTSDIARGLTTSLADAERLKTLYGSAIGTSVDQNEMIDVPQLGDSSRKEINHVPRSLLIGIIQPRIEEILELVRAKLKESGFGDLVGRRVVLTGGASQLPGMRDLAQLVLDKQVRLGGPIRVAGLPDSVSSPAFATTVGLLNCVATRSHEIPADIIAQMQPENLFDRVKLWLRENW